LRSHATRWSSWLQIAIAISIVAAIGAGVYYKATAATRDTLYIELGELRSRAAESRRVADDAAAQRLADAFVRGQSQQLAKAVAKLRDELADARAKDASPDVARAQALAEELLALVGSLRGNGASPDVAREVARRTAAIVDALIPLERAARPS
jgi:hypothetical protein